MRQLICSNCFTVKSYHDTCKRINSSVTDFVKEGAINSSKSTSNDVLMTWKNIPIGFYDIPTLNNMIYSRKLWQSLFDNPILKSCIENRCFWGEAHHADRDEVWLDEVACRLTDWRFGDNNLVLGDLDLMNTPKGLIAYTCAQTGRIGSSTRGYGNLRPIDGSLTEVDQDTYLHVCSDLVALPACSEAYMGSASTEALTREGIEHMTQELRNLVESSVEKNRSNVEILSLLNQMCGGKYTDDIKRMKIASAKQRLQSYKEQTRYADILRRRCSR